METAIDILMKVVRAFDKLEIPYVIGGSFASSFHGLLRTTNDIDFVATIRETQAEAIASEFAEEFYVDADSIQRAVRAKRAFNMIHFDSSFKIDVFIAGADGFQQQELQRRELKNISVNPPCAAYISTPEDIILAKLDWYRRGNFTAQQQWRDIANVIRVQSRKLDYAYLREWAAQLGVSELLEQALEESLSE